MEATDYIPSVGSRLSKKQAVVFGNRLSEISEKRGFITPKIVVKDAESKSSPLHSYFDWNDTIAAKRWRIEQAKYLLRTISVTIVSENKPAIRHFFSITPTKEMKTDEIRVYVPVSAVMSNKDSRKEVIAYALRELEGWTQRYSQYSELFGVIKEIKARMKKVKA